MISSSDIQALPDLRLRRNPTARCYADLDGFTGFAGHFVQLRLRNAKPSRK